ncbi:MAG: hypothetical protein EOO09_20065 [Chitinophagaceae bacterium]|nr:MAG: hypothetical protein EOO09_20065 [Chitinophagaceae bacterium]
MSENKNKITEKNQAEEDEKAKIDGDALLTLDKNAELGIGNDMSGIDNESASNTKRLTSKLNLTDEQKQEVRALFRNDFDTSVTTLKEDIKKEGQEVKKDFLTIFGLFASFVTFLSIEVQVFKNKDNAVELIGICSISLSFVLFFALVINDIAKDKQEWKDFLKPSHLLNVAFLIVGIIFLLIGNSSSNSRVGTLQKQNETDRLKIDSLQQNIYGLKREIRVLDSSVSSQNKSLTDSLEELRKMIR